MSGKANSIHSFNHLLKEMPECKDEGLLQNIVRLARQQLTELQGIKPTIVLLSEHQTDAEWIARDFKQLLPKKEFSNLNFIATTELKEMDNPDNTLIFHIQDNTSSRLDPDLTNGEIQTLVESGAKHVVAVVLATKGGARSVVISLPSIDYSGINLKVEKNQVKVGCKIDTMLWCVGSRKLANVNDIKEPITTAIRTWLAEKDNSSVPLTSNDNKPVENNNNNVEETVENQPQADWQTATVVGLLFLEAVILLGLFRLWPNNSQA